jgi:uncharacterized protein YjbJ (UPF0337 family)
MEGKLMSWDRIEGDWKNFKGKVREKWGKLTDDDVDVIGGKKDQLVGRLQERYGYAKDKIDEEIDSFCAECNNPAGTRRADEGYVDERGI